MADWISDPDLSVEDKLKHFESLKPRLTRGPYEIDMPFTKPTARPDLTFSGALSLSAPHVAAAPSRGVLTVAPNAGARTTASVPADA